MTCGTQDGSIQECIKSAVASLIFKKTIKWVFQCTNDHMHECYKWYPFKSNECVTLIVEWPLLSTWTCLPGYMLKWEKNVVVAEQIPMTIPATTSSNLMHWKHSCVSSLVFTTYSDSWWVFPQTMRAAVDLAELYLACRKHLGCENRWQVVEGERGTYENNLEFEKWQPKMHTKWVRVGLFAGSSLETWSARRE